MTLRKLFLQSGLLIAVLSTPALFGQMSITGSITGSVTDPSGQMIPGATVTVTSQATRDTRTATTNELGAFNVVAIPAGVYDVKIESSGFKSNIRRGLVLSANQRLVLGDITLEVGAVSDSVSVVAESVRVATDSSEVSAQITTDQVQTLTARGRDIVSLMRTIPGIGYAADADSVGGQYGSGTPAVMGGTSNSMAMLAVDGITSNDMGTPSVFSSVTTMDAIGEVRVIMNGYQAEYAGNGGPVMEVITKGGGTEYHGSGYWYVRNEKFNANDFFNNRNGVKRPEYRYNTFGFSLGGPIYIPGKFNKERNKLFGFYNLEDFIQRVPNSASLTYYTMPSALERKGDFSQTFDTGGKLIPITDPTSRTPFPGNVVPTSRLDPNGLALLKMLPLPNFVNPAITGYNYNYQIQEIQDWPKRSQLFKIDYVPSSNDRVFVRGKTWLSMQQGYSVASGATPIGFFAQCYCFSEEGLATGWTHIFSPRLVMEATAGVRHNHEGWTPFEDKLTPAQLIPQAGNPMSTVLRSAVGFTAGQWFPQANPDGIIPRATYNVPNSPNVGFDDRFLKNGTDFVFTINDNFTYTYGGHTFKAGIAANRFREYEGERSVFSGTFNFSKDTNNPLDTNWAFANAALGVFQSYQESNARYGANERESVVEWFVQDTWKVTRRLTLDYGVRFTWYNQMYPAKDGQQSVLALSRYQVSKAPVLYRPAMNNGVRSALNPITGQYLPAAYIGLYVPNSGDPVNGGVVSGDNSYPRGFVHQEPMLPGPRLGFAWDVFGNGKTAIRAGAGMLYNYRLSKWSQTTANPPVILTPITYYGTIGTFLQSAGTLGPSNTNTYNVNNKTPGTYNITFGIEQDLGHNTLLNISYLGVLGRHLQTSYNINTIPYGARFLAANQDPTSPGKPLPDNFFRPYPGYNNITLYDNMLSSNYHGLLFSASRRFTRSIQGGVSYTLAKFMDYAAPPLYRPMRTWSYGVNGSDQRHNLVFNYSYDLPKLSKVWANPVAKWAFDNWIWSGIAQFVTGTPAAVGFSTTDGTDMTGGGDGQRINVIGDSAAGGHTFYQWFNTAAFARPGMNDPGNAGRYSVRNPGVNNWDMAISKRFNIKSEKRFFQVRWEAYNAFNHTQYSGLNTTARFDPAGNQVNAQFGQVTSTRTPRIMQGSLRLTF